MTNENHQKIQLCDRAVVVAARGEAAAQVVRFVCEGLQPTPSEEPASLQLMSDGANFRLDVGEAKGEHLGDAFAAAEALMTEIARLLVWDYRTGMALHTGLIRVGGHDLLLPAGSGAGKSTLSVYAGLYAEACICDELVFAPAAGAEVTPLLRPAHLKRGSAFLLPDLRASGATLWEREQAALVPVASLGAGAGPRRPSAMVFPCYEPGATLHLAPLSRARATVALLGSLVNARNLPDAGILWAGQFASVVPGFALTYSRLTDALAALSGGPWV